MRNRKSTSTRVATRKRSLRLYKLYLKFIGDLRRARASNIKPECQTTISADQTFFSPAFFSSYPLLISQIFLLLRLKINLLVPAVIVHKDMDNQFEKLKLQKQMQVQQ